MSIIERDLEFYRGEVERLRDDLRRCHPDDESTIWAKMMLATRVVVSLRDYALALGFVVSE